ncbi:MAG: type II toxin-antitoxin system prevent-host-death family antitoxin [Gemmatimonadaceae bacterium]
MLAPVASWSLSDAKSRFSELVRQAVAAGPQLVMRGRESAVVVVDAREFARLTQPATSLLAFLEASPLADVELEFPGARELPREVDL